MAKKQTSAPRKENKRKKRSLKATKTQSHIGKIVDTLAYPFYMMSLDHRIIAANAAAKKVGIVAGKHCYEATHGLDEPCSGAHECPLRDVIRLKKPINVEHVHYSRRGARKFVEIYAAPMLNSNGDVVNVLESAIDVTKRKEAEMAVQTIFKSLSETTGQVFFDSLVRNLYDWLGAESVLVSEIIGKSKLQTLSMVEKGKVVGGYTCSLSGTPCAELLKKTYVFYPEGVKKRFTKAKKLIKSKIEAYVGVSLVDRNNKMIGTICALSSKKLVLPPQAKEVLLILAARAASEIERKHYEDRLNRLSITDELTNLNNRRGFFMLAEHHLKLIKRNKGTAALFFMDLNNMKTINDVKGHAAGDKALVTVAGFLKNIFRESDVVARIGGDEFAVFTANITKSNAAILKQRIQEKFKIYNKSKRASIALSVSVGIAYCNDLIKYNFDALLRKADKEMYIEKSKQKKKIQG